MVDGLQDIPNDAPSFCHSFVVGVLIVQMIYGCTSCRSIVTNEPRGECSQYHKANHVTKGKGKSMFTMSESFTVVPLK
jgi:hypothetical protein